MNVMASELEHRIPWLSIWLGTDHLIVVKYCVELICVLLKMVVILNKFLKIGISNYFRFQSKMR